MRLVGLLLVLLGALTLGYEGFGSTTRDATDSEIKESHRHRAESRHTQPLAGGIAMVSGLLLLASGSRHEER